MLAFVALGAWLDRARSRDWDAHAARHRLPDRGGDDAATPQLRRGPRRTRTSTTIESFFAERGRASHGVALDRAGASPRVARRAGRCRRALPDRPGPLAIALWSLRLRYWALRASRWNDPLPTPDIQVFALYHAPASDGRPLPDSVGLSKGLIAVAHLYAERRGARQQPGRDGARAAAHARRDRQVRPRDRAAARARRARRPGPRRRSIRRRSARSWQAASRCGAREAVIPDGPRADARRPAHRARDRVERSDDARSGPVLDCRGVTVEVPGRDAGARPGRRIAGRARVLAVLGRNGAGKSSTLHALAGLRPPARGEVGSAAARSARGRGASSRARSGLLPQASRGSVPGDGARGGARRAPSAPRFLGSGKAPTTAPWPALPGRRWTSRASSDATSTTLSGGERRRLVDRDDPGAGSAGVPARRTDPAARPAAPARGAATASARSPMRAGPSS